MTEKSQNQKAVEQKQTSASNANKNNASNKIAVIRIRGEIRIRHDIKRTLEGLRLYDKNFCSLVEDTQSNKGRINKVKDYITYGPINKETETLLFEKRGEEFKERTTCSKGKINYKHLTFNNKNYKPYFRLNSPKKGFGRKGIKITFAKGGALGPRNDKIQDLIQRMV